ncbi:MAG: AMP-binding protein [Gammaproteobacteria bacterium]|nr:AMP-binding protein [Gammaproteobacteria bacterium]MCP5458931.1 AMP-binding protein [Gammaproteobacteria bacterium]
MAFYDLLEAREQTERDIWLRKALPAQIAHAQKHAPAFARILQGVNPEAVVDRASLAKLPVVRKSELIDSQHRDPPFGGLVAAPVGALAQVFQSPGPIYDPEARRPDFWRFARALFAAGFRAGDLIHNTFSYHFTPAGSMLATGASALGCAVFPAGVGQTELQVRAIHDLRPQGYVGTPSFLKIILDRAADLQADVSSLQKALVTAEALPPSLREEFNSRGVRTFQCYATADLGLIAYETPALEGMVVDEGVLVEIVRPGTGEPVPEGEVGELVITTFNPEYPLIRFATGDLSAVLPGISSCGRTNTRIRGWLGRADQTTKVRGMFIHPSQIAEVLKRHSQIIKARLHIEQRNYQDAMTLYCEVDGILDEGQRKAIEGTIRDVCKLRGELNIVAPGTLPNDGKVIDDVRDYK